MEYTYIGKDTPVSDAAAKAMGSLQYAGDMHLPQMLHMKLVLSPVAHGQILAIDAVQALQLSGVEAVLSFENTPATTYNRGRVRASEEKPDQETLFSRHVRFVGDRVAAVIARTPELAQKAASLIKLDIHRLAAVFDPRQALTHPDFALHDTDNIVHLPPLGYGDYEKAEGIEFCHHTRSQRITHMAMEPHCAVADYDPGRERMTVWTATQSVFGVRSAIATVLELPMSHIRVIKAPMGGSFGSKQEMILEPLVAYAAKQLSCPVKLQLSRREVMLCTMLKHPVDSTIRAKFSGAGKLQAISLDFLLDAGAYQTNSPAYAMGMMKKVSRTYQFPNYRCQASTVCTNTPVSGSYRGWGAPEVTLLMENMMNAAARHFGWDPVELRLKNILPPHAICKFDHSSLGDLHLKEALRLGHARFGWQARKERIDAQDRNGRYLRGIGMAMGTHTCGFYPWRADWGTVTLKMEEDGSVHVNCNVHDHGCGCVTAFQNIVAEVLSLSPKLVDIPEGDTAYNALDNGCYASRSIYVLGGAIERASRQLLAKLKQHAASLLGCQATQLQHRDGVMFCKDAPQHRCTYSQIAYYAADHDRAALYVTESYVPDTNPAPAGVHFAEVEVDTYTGFCRVVDYLAVHDIGKALNPALCRGQIGSALQQGIGIVFCEEIIIDPVTGRPRNACLQRYPVARASELPEIDVIFVEKGDENGPFGAKSLGEISYVPVAPALIAAVNHALDLDLSVLPLSPARILAAMDEKKEGC